MIAILDLHGFKKAIFIPKFTDMIHVPIAPERKAVKDFGLLHGSKVLRFEFEKGIDEDTMLHKFTEARDL